MFQMENIGNFLNGCKAYGLPIACVFQVVDLFEGQNMPLVKFTIVQFSFDGYLLVLVK